MVKCYILIIFIFFNFQAFAKEKARAKVKMSEAVLVCKDFYSPTDVACSLMEACCPPIIAAYWEIEEFALEIPPVKIKGSLPKCNFDPCRKQVENNKLLAKGFYVKDKITLGRIFQIQSFKVLNRK